MSFSLVSLNIAQTALKLNLLKCPILGRLWLSVKTDLNATDLQTGHTSAFIKVVTLAAFDCLVFTACSAIL